MGDITPNVVWHAGHYDRAERWGALDVRGATIWFTGLSSASRIL